VSPPLCKRPTASRGDANLTRPISLLACLAFAVPASAEPRTDAHGDPLPEGAVARFGTVRYRIGVNLLHGKVALSPDGKTIAVPSKTGIALFDVHSGRLTAEFPLYEPYPDFMTHKLGYSPDGKYLVRLTGGFAQVVDARTGRLLYRRFLNDRDDIWGMAFLPGTSKLVINGDHWATTFDVATDKVVRHLNFQEDMTLVRPAGRLLLGYKGFEWLVFDLASGKLRARLQRIGPDTSGTYGEEWAVTPDSRHLCLISNTGRFRVVDVETGITVVDQTREPPKDNGWYIGIAVSPDGNVVYVRDPSAEVRRWDMKAHRWLAPLPIVEPGVLLPHPDGAQLLVASRVLRRYDVRSLREIHGPEGYWASVNVSPSPDGRRIAISAECRGPESQLDVVEIGGRRQWSLRSADACRSVSWSPDGRWLIRSEGDGDNRVARLREARTGRLIRSLTYSDESGWLGDTAYFTPDSRQLICPIGSGASIAMFDVRTGRCGAVVDPNEQGVIDVSPDGRVILFAATDGFRLYDRVADRFLTDPTAERTEDGRLATEQAKFSPDGSYLLVWEGETRDPARRYGYVATVRDPVSGRCRLSFDVGPDSVEAFALSPDGQWLAYGTDRGELHLWDVAAACRLGKWSGHRDTIRSIGFAGMSRVVTGSDDFTALVWDPRPKQRPTKPLWEALSGDDAVEAYRAVWALAADPIGPDLLRAKITPMPSPRPEQIRQWLSDLSSDRFAVRERATRELERVRRSVGPDLRAALQQATGEEVRARLNRLLASITPERTPAEAIQARAATAMELAGTVAAKKLLADWAAGAPGARLTQDAKAALVRLSVTVPNR
jgi:WD40 repeat protein